MGYRDLTSHIADVVGFVWPDECAHDLVRHVTAEEVQRVMFSMSSDNRALIALQWTSLRRLGLLSVMILCYGDPLFWVLFLTLMGECNLYYFES